MIIKALFARGFTRRHAAVDCLATNLDYELVMELDMGRNLRLVVDLVDFAYDADTIIAICEPHDARIAFQLNHKLTERYATAQPALTDPMPGGELFQFVYALDTFQQHYMMAGETALRVAVRILLLDSRIGLLQYSEIARHRSDIFTQLLDIACRPRPSSVIHCQSNFLAMLISRLLLSPPGPQYYAAWGYLNIDNTSPDFIQEQMEAFIRNVAILYEDPLALPKLHRIYQESAPVSYREMFE